MNAEQQAFNVGLATITSMDYHPVGQTDLMACVELFISVFNQPPWNESWDVETATQRLEDLCDTPGFYGIIMKNGEEAIGIAMGYIERWDKSKLFYLKEMCIAPARQRQGVGTALMGELEKRLTSEGVTKLYLHTARDTSAQTFYESQGFHVSPRMIMMSKWLSAE